MQKSEKSENSYGFKIRDEIMQQECNQEDPLQRKFARQPLYLTDKCTIQYTNLIIHKFIEPDYMYLVLK